MVSPELVMVYIGVAISWFLGVQTWHGLKFLGHIIKVGFHHFIGN